MERIMFSGGATSDAVTITGGAIPVLNRAVEPGHDATLDRTWGGAKVSYVASISTGTVKATPGVLYAIWPTTSGTIVLKDGATAFPTITASAGAAWPAQLITLPCPITFTTAISVTASAAVAFYFYI